MCVTPFGRLEVPDGIGRALGEEGRGVVHQLKPLGWDVPVGKGIALLSGETLPLSDGFSTRSLALTVTISLFVAQLVPASARAPDRPNHR